MVIYIIRFSKLPWKQRGRFLLLLLSWGLTFPAARSQISTAISGSFEKEMSAYGTGRSDTTLLPAAYSFLPPWFSTQFPEQGDTLFVFGISDPGLTDTIARQQAVFRALALGTLTERTDCDHISDLYSQEGGDGAETRYEEIYRFSAAFYSKIPAATILGGAILPSSEAIVLMAIPYKSLQNGATKNMRIETILYNNEADFLFGNKMSRKVDFSIQQKKADDLILMDASSFYQVNGKATGMRCLFPQSQAVYTRYEFYYASGDSTNSKYDGYAFSGTTCKQGLWIAYVSQILDQLSLQAKMLTRESQVLSDKTKNSSTELVRERSRIRLSWRIKNIDIHDNQMWVSLTISKI